MSYCRWSSDGFRSDVYVYEDVNGGWTTHVAGNRRLHLDTLPPDPYTPKMLQKIRDKEITHQEWAENYKAYSKALGELPLVEIDLPHAAKTFNDPSPGACADRLEALRALGYYVPQYAIDELREEQNENNPNDISSSQTDR